MNSPRKRSRLALVPDGADTPATPAAPDSAEKPAPQAAASSDAWGLAVQATALPWRLAEAFWRSQSGLNASLEQDARVEAEEARTAHTPQELAQLGFELGAARYWHLLRWAEQIGAEVLDAQSKWLRSLQAVMAQGLGPWFARPELLGSAQEVFEPPPDYNPGTLFAKAYETWAKLGAAGWSALQTDARAER